MSQSFVCLFNGVWVGTPQTGLALRFMGLVQNYHSSDKDIPNSNNVHKTVRDRTITKQIADLEQAHKTQR
jgi:hypothetical protein